MYTVDQTPTGQDLKNKKTETEIKHGWWWHHYVKRRLAGLEPKLARSNERQLRNTDPNQGTDNMYPKGGQKTEENQAGFNQNPFHSSTNPSAFLCATN